MVFFKTRVCIIILKICLPFEIVHPIIACNFASTVRRTILKTLKTNVIVYCVTREGSELFLSRAKCAARAADEGRISPTTEIVFPHEPHILFCHVSGFIDHGKGILQASMQQPDYNSVSYFTKGTIWFYLF